LSLSAQDVFKYAGNDPSLDARWSWALHEAKQSENVNEFWIGYSIKRLMSNDSYILSNGIFSGPHGTRESISTVLSLDQPAAVNEKEGARVFKRLKDVGLFFRINAKSSDAYAIEAMSLCDLELSIDLKKDRVYWLGSTDEDQSVGRLKKLLTNESPEKVKKALVEAIGIHQTSALVYPLLGEILAGSSSDEVRSQAAFWIGEQNNPAGLKLLLGIAENDKSLKVREQAVFGLSRYDSEASTDALIALARTAKDTKIRSKAAFWLGQKASQKAVVTLEDIVAGDEESEVQRQALFGLSQTKDKEGVERLIKIAETHPNPRIRKLAIQLLGQSDDPKALDAIIAIVRK
jgi:HEAT repeat protein